MLGRVAAHIVVAAASAIGTNASNNRIATISHDRS